MLNFLLCDVWRAVFKLKPYYCEAIIFWINVFEYPLLNEDKLNRFSEMDASRLMISSPNGCFPPVNTKYTTQPLRKISNFSENFFRDT